jgi:hypothetical protein
MWNWFQASSSDPQEQLTKYQHCANLSLVRDFLSPAEKKDCSCWELQPNEVTKCCLQLGYSAKMAEETNERITAAYNRYEMSTFYDRLAERCYLPPAYSCSPLHTTGISELMDKCKAGGSAPFLNLSFDMNFHLRAILTASTRLTKQEIDHKVHHAIHQANHLRACKQ